MKSDVVIALCVCTAIGFVLAMVTDEFVDLSSLNDYYDPSRQNPTEQELYDEAIQRIYSPEEFKRAVDLGALHYENLSDIMKSFYDALNSTQLDINK